MENVVCLYFPLEKISSAGRLANKSQFSGHWSCLVATMDGASYFTVDAALYLSPPDLKTCINHYRTDYANNHLFCEPEKFNLTFVYIASNHNNKALYIVR